MAEVTEVTKRARIERQLSYITVRIEAKLGRGSGFGTGFFLAFPETETAHLPVLVTNKHVLAGAESALLFLAGRKPSSDEPDLPAIHVVRVNNIQNSAISHPDPKVDLCAIPMASLLSQLKAQGIAPYMRHISYDTVADAAFLDTLDVGENIIMVGYPNGLWDEVNNQPLVRRGITATSPSLDFNSRKEFVIDCACFPGSSGSPVLLFDRGGYINEHGQFLVGAHRTKLIGVLYAGPQLTIDGKLEVVPIPTSAGYRISSKTVMNLGYCIKSTELRVFADIMLERMARGSDS